jgi:hypothetical protein
MIYATAARISEIIAGDLALLRAMHAFLEAADIGDGLGALLDELPAAIAVHSPFESEQDVVEVVRREMLLALHTLALRRLPAKGRA